MYGRHFLKRIFIISKMYGMTIRISQIMYFIGLLDLILNTSHIIIIIINFRKKNKKLEDWINVII